MHKKNGPKFVRYIPLVTEALKELGSSARPSEVCDWISDNVNVPKKEIEETTKGGQTKFENMVAWARFYLAKAGYIDAAKRGVWVLTPKGKDTKISNDDAFDLFLDVQQRFQAKKKTATTTQDTTDTFETNEEQVPDQSDFINQQAIQEDLVREIYSMTASGFEEFSAYLLRVLGFENVKVSGKSGDQGVDGEGELVLNRFVRTRVIFQCKRYKKAVTPEKIRDFRGAMHGRAERGIFITSGTYTKGAHQEAYRDNAIPIELIDIDKLIELLIEESIGVEERRALQINTDFFQTYQ